ncbi:IDEAL domain-containing protein [Mesobacillus maritimus]|uniref:IDEAL domain-containing protein n=1 Tax=Mesobacillus maritimus TaxID=1643336 RepID=UPI00203F2AB6|nr:IDEAL domain-containing protein [Mesobacillus maritimus]MCM3586672.1 IDEAL domain-containing protein [Mesobacillus maritimus]MCM3668574.1 IDEAL domain-containing protein [Mesobacillus maritimus]
MLPNKNKILKIGDWVKGSSRDGELIIGYIDSINILEELVNVKVVKSDNPNSISCTFQLNIHQVKILPESNVTNKEQIRFLIDLALSTGDEEWFLELSSKIQTMEQLVRETT